MAMLTDKRPEEIRFLLNCKGLTFAAVARACGLPESTVRNTTRKPNTNGEIALASFLGLAANQIWPSRYNADGTRLKPQPPENYSRFARLRHCQKAIRD